MQLRELFDGVAAHHGAVGIHQTCSEKPRPSGRGVKGAGRKATGFLEIGEILYKVTV